MREREREIANYSLVHRHISSQYMLKGIYRRKKYV